MSSSLALSDEHSRRGAHFQEVNGCAVVAHYGDPRAEYEALQRTVGIFDLSFRGRVCVLGEDRVRFLNGQVTNDVAALAPWRGCYAALITAKGKMLSDLNIYRLENELLLDFEPGLTAKIMERLEHYVIADDVQLVDVAPHHGLFSLQGPDAARLAMAVFAGTSIPAHRMEVSRLAEADHSEIYLVNQPRYATSGMDVYVPVAKLNECWHQMIHAASSFEGRPCGWQAAEMARIEVGLPRFGADMDETNLPPEAGLEQNGISYTKGCYIGQEVIARIRTYGQVAKALRTLRLDGSLKSLPQRGDKLLRDVREVGYITSAAFSPKAGGNVALGYVRREANQIGSELVLRTTEGESPVEIAGLAFSPFIVPTSPVHTPPTPPA